ncbi:MAG: hypothetical protein O7D86_11255 [Proteobacteria bacterium]|nr:hypothetical protein [Pseudomonadota bacterium]
MLASPVTGEDGSRSEFESHPVRRVTGAVVEMMLAERGTYWNSESSPKGGIKPP